MSAENEPRAWQPDDFSRKRAEPAPRWTRFARAPEDHPTLTPREALELRTLKKIEVDG